MHWTNLMQSQKKNTHVGVPRMEKKNIILVSLVSIILLINSRPTTSTACLCGNPGLCQLSTGKPLCEGYCSGCSSTACKCGNPGLCELSSGKPLCSGYCRGCSSNACSCGNPGLCELSSGRPVCSGYCSGCRLRADVAGNKKDKFDKKGENILEKDQEV